MFGGFVTPWGIKPFDDAIGGLPSNVFNVVQTENNQVGLLALGHFLMEGLIHGERCTLLTFENPLTFLESFEALHFDFYKYLKSEQFMYLSYRSNISQEIGLSQSYESLIAEVHRLSLQPSHRVALHQMDTLLNLQSQMLINACTLKLVGATNNSSSTFLGQFVNFPDPTYRAVRIACLKTMSGYFSLKNASDDDQNILELRVERIPSFEHIERRVGLQFELGKGFIGLGEGSDGKAA